MPTTNKFSVMFRVILGLSLMGATQQCFGGGEDNPSPSIKTGRSWDGTDENFTAEPTFYDLVRYENPENEWGTLEWARAQKLVNSHDEADFDTLSRQSSEILSEDPYGLFRGSNEDGRIQSEESLSEIRLGGEAAAIAKPKTGHFQTEPRGFFSNLGLKIGLLKPTTEEIEAAAEAFVKNRTDFPYDFQLLINSNAYKNKAIETEQAEQAQLKNPQNKQQRAFRRQ